MIKKIFKSSFFWFFFFVTTIVMVFYLFYLNQEIIARFESRRWNLPSRIYSEAFPLFKGKKVKTEELYERLLYLGYREVFQTPQHLGQFMQRGGRFIIMLQSFDYPHEKFPGGGIEVSLKNEQIESLKNYPSQTNLDIINLEPELIASVFDEQMEDRTVVSLKKMPQHLIDAILTIEDERFYSHFGIDPIGISRAFFVNLTKMRLVQGASTITQQLVKNFFLHHKKTFQRKFNEVFMALLMERRYTKQEILEAYLNEIYFGQRGAASITGVQEAARFYFSKSAAEVTVPEAALLAAIINGPGVYSPFIHPKNAKKRRDLVLAQMLKHQKITQKQYNEFIQTPLPKKTLVKQLTTAPYFVDFVKKQLKENYPQDVLSSEGLRIFTTLDMFLQRVAEKAVEKWLSKLEAERTYLKTNASQNKFLSGALIAVQPKTGNIVAYVGGRNYSTSQFDNISEALRQPGSIFKPFVYLAALDPKTQETAQPFTLASLIQDKPVTFNVGGSAWTAKNYDNKYHGEVTLRAALENSYNAATVWLADQIGLDKIVGIAKEAGISSQLEPYPAMSLGAFEVTPLEITGAYTIFPNNGVRSRPLSIRRVMTKDGEALEKKTYHTDTRFSHDVIYLMNQLLKGVLDRGTATSARAMGFQKLAAGKTGTTSDYRDAWFAGYTPDILAVVWVGYADNQPTRLSGSSGALPIWTDFMLKAAKQDYNDFSPTQNHIRVKIDRKTGLLYEQNCFAFYEEYFIEGTEPTEFCRGQKVVPSKKRDFNKNTHKKKKKKWLGIF